MDNNATETVSKLQDALRHKQLMIDILVHQVNRAEMLLLRSIESEMQALTGTKPETQKVVDQLLKEFSEYSNWKQKIQSGDLTSEVNAILEQDAAIELALKLYLENLQQKIRRLIEQIEETNR